MMNIDNLKKGDCFFNYNKSHVGIVLKITKNHVYYKWHSVDNPEDVHTISKVKKETCEVYARKWAMLSSLEKELFWTLTI